ncbi:sodium:proton antiporter NhaD [Duganella violaceipulchra]|uniref:Na+/H+ antiporter NhaD/arsenite permease-like protein n=1 Tax=Duganella violaceipulchra TaxID=2849652 RepID=A0AA41LA05_9BURK|nr:sodium:proton antiporter NhaD [Duganella violaceicalia]MBV6323770.1 sodium:proton antiporter NhaD [Duganella violaceicalia]MCP2007460.1 Na+/H+ antiporter NhaD/arsenite permease-like protein [Duganella violaceicalia]
MLILLIVVFIIAYAAIALEHPIGVNKSASALVGAGLLWTIYALGVDEPRLVGEKLDETVAATAQIVFFLMGAMAIVEVVDSHHGFELITSRIKTTSLTSLLWLVGLVTFFLSAVLDNLTTTIVMISLSKKLLDQAEDRLYFAGMIVLAANAGGAWSPIGDVTTTMLWIGGQLSSTGIVQAVLMPSLVNLLVPLAISAFVLRGRSFVAPAPNAGHASATSASDQALMLTLGIGILLAVPLFKTMTHLPPFMGILFGLGLLWLVGELIHRNKDVAQKEALSLTSALQRIDMGAIVFFIGILLAVATLEHAHILKSLAEWLDRAVGRQEVIVVLLGLLSAIVDNVPLVAASMGMYSTAQFPMDHQLWDFIAYCAGTGGSMLIIGSAAGVAAMSLEKIQFIWYLRKISGLALIGYLAGAATYLAQYSILH